MDDSFYLFVIKKIHSWKVCHSICRYPLPLSHPHDSCSVCDGRSCRSLSCVCAICASCASSSFCPLCRRSAFSWICTRYFCCCRCRCPTPSSPSSSSSSFSSPGGRTRKEEILFCVAEILNNDNAESRRQFRETNHETIVLHYMEQNQPPVRQHF